MSAQFPNMYIIYSACGNCINTYKWVFIFSYRCWFGKEPGKYIDYIYQGPVILVLLVSLCVGLRRTASK